MLLKGFGKPRGKKTYVTVFHFDRGTFVVPTDGIAAEREFYSEVSEDPSVFTLDDKITNYENFISEAISLIRSNESGQSVDGLLASKLITHLIIRNRFVRLSSTAMADALFGELAGVFSNKEAAQRFLGLGSDQPSKRFETALSDALVERKSEIAESGLSEAEASDLIFNLMKSNFSQIHQMLEPLVGVLSRAREDASLIAENAQKRGMDEDLSPVKRVEEMQKFEWRSIDAENGLILPDCVAISVMNDRSVLPLILSGFDDVDRILMPVSSERMLVGARSSDFDLPRDFNEMASHCSWDFFIGSDKSDEYVDMSSNIRVNLGAFSGYLARTAMHEALNEE